MNYLHTNTLESVIYNIIRQCAQDLRRKSNSLELISPISSSGHDFDSVLDECVNADGTSCFLIVNTSPDTDEFGCGEVVTCQSALSGTEQEDIALRDGKEGRCFKVS